MSKKPRISVKLQDGQLLPCSAYDAEQLALATHNAELDLVLRTKRSEQHHKLYWSILGKACKATGKWPNSDNLHRELKMACGFFQTVVSEFGGIYYFPDTIAINKMNQKEFNEYFDQAMAKLSETLQYDPTVLE